MTNDQQCMWDILKSERPRSHTYTYFFASGENMIYYIPETNEKKIKVFVDNKEISNWSFFNGQLTLHTTPPYSARVDIHIYGD